jgi:hypothetical protein
MPPATVPTTRASLAADENRLKTLLHVFLDVPNPTTEAAEYNKHEIVCALNHEGIMHFRRDFLSMSESDIQELKAPDANDDTLPLQPISLFNKRCLIILLAFYHRCCAEVSREVKIKPIPRTGFDEFRTREYDPNSPICPWKAVMANSGTTPESELSVWKKSVCPNKADYKEFRDESFWVRSKEQFTTTLESHSLAHLIDKAHVVTDADLDQAQHGWLSLISNLDEEAVILAANNQDESAKYAHSLMVIKDEVMAVTLETTLNYRTESVRPRNAKDPKTVTMFSFYVASNTLTCKSISASKYIKLWAQQGSCRIMSHQLLESYVLWP